MPCVHPIRASFDEAGEVSFSKKKWSKEFVPFEFPCRKCIFCRLETAREKAIRCIHHAQQTGEKNIFLTLTYDEQNLKSPKLIYSDWQKFMKDLRNEIGSKIEDRISVVVTGEYGDLGKRPHWHALLFNYRPEDEKEERRTQQGDSVFMSPFLHDLWGKGKIEYGEVTFESAGYVARYAAKKLVHGPDHEHDFHPIHRTSSKIPIGRPWIEKYWKQTFENGFVVLPNGKISGIPRYYEDWFKKQMPNQWYKYITEVKPEMVKKSIALRAREMELFLKDSMPKNPNPWNNPKSRNEVKEEIQLIKHEEYLKGLKL